MTLESRSDVDDGLQIYMNDQLALGVLWRDIARKAERKNRGSDLGTALASVAAGIAEDVATFESLMDRLKIPRSRIKRALASVAAQGVRLKLNGRLRTYTPLGRFEELDFLAIGIDGKKLLWATLRDCANLAEQLPDVDFDHLIERAEYQRSQIEPFRQRAASEAWPGAPTELKRR